MVLPGSNFTLFSRPNCNNTLFNAWEALLSETETDAQGYTDIAGVFSRSVSRPLLEKTFHMKIQSRKVFLHRESYENILNKTEQMLLKVSLIRNPFDPAFNSMIPLQCHDDYCMAFDFHVAQNNADSAMALTEAHNNYVQQLHAANGMIDQYYNNSLPHLLQVKRLKNRCLAYRYKSGSFRSWTMCTMTWALSVPKPLFKEPTLLLSR